MEEEISFPRGRATKVDDSSSKKKISSTDDTEKKKKKRARSDSGDFLFGSNNNTSNELSGAKDKKKKSKSRRDEKDDNSMLRPENISMMPLGGGSVLPPISDSSGRRPALIESLSFSKLAKGMKLLGMVREISEEYAVVSLPNMWTGFLTRKTDVPLTRVLSLHQVLSVIVQKTTSQPSSQKKTTKEASRRRIELSIDPIHINAGLMGTPNLELGRHIRGVITSCEDHGCLVDIGIPRVRCFLSYENIKGKYRLLPEIQEDSDDNDDDDEEMDDDENEWLLNKGRVYDFTITSLPSADSPGGIVQLTLQSTDKRSKYLTTPAVLPSANPTLRTLLPGMLVTAYVEQHAKNGLCVSFLNNVFRGAIDMTGLGGFYAPELFSKDSTSSKGKGNSNKKDEMWFKKVFSGKFRFVSYNNVLVIRFSYFYCYSYCYCY